MSEAHANRHNDLNVEASAWVVRRELPNWGEADQTEFENWLNKSSQHKVAFLRTADVWTRADRLRALTPPAQGDTAALKRRQILRAVSRGAAAMVLAVVVGAAGFIYLSRPREVIYTTATGGHETIPLADGSQIELNTGTVLRVSDTGSQRVVRLERGEAYFNVKHDAKHLFLVFAAGHRITDVGTKFQVRSDGVSLRVALLEGRAQLDSIGAWSEARATLLMPGDVAVAEGRRLTLTKKPVEKLASSLSWRQGILVFENTPLADAVEELNRYNVQKLVVADESVGRLKIDASIPINGVEIFARVARQAIGLRVERRGDEVIISR